MRYTKTIGRWDVFEAVLRGPEDGNPFLEQHVYGVFTSSSESVQTEGFYDGEGIYRIRFMPSFEGTYSFVLKTTFDEKNYSGNFYVTSPEEKNHGPVHVENTYHFAYADGTPYYSVGTTAYVWELQSNDLQKKTLNSLVDAQFNKLRFCIFPKHYIYNFNDPEVFPYVGTPMDASVLNEDNFMDYIGKAEGNDFDYKTFNPEYFRRIERKIYELGLLGIEADLIVMHPYDRWGFSCMSREEDELYWKYVVNRFAAFHNVWWSLANEWDLLKGKTIEDWEFYGNLLVKKDPYHHLRSIHNCLTMYDHGKDWITHCSVQRIDLYKGAELTNEIRERFQKPVVMDEIAYEGNIPYGWGNITAEEMVRRFYETVLRGGYPGHGETYLSEDNILWWSHGGELQGDSWKRVGFLYRIMQDVPGTGLSYLPNEWDSVCSVLEEEIGKTNKSFYLFYYSFMRPSYRDFHIDDETEFVVDVIDTWNMTIESRGIHSGKFRVQLPAKPYMMIRLRKATEEDYPSVEEKEEDSSWLDQLYEEQSKPKEADVLEELEENEDLEDSSEEEIVEVPEEYEIGSIEEFHGQQSDGDEIENLFDNEDVEEVDDDQEESSDFLQSEELEEETDSEYEEEGIEEDDEEDFDVFDLAPLDDTFTKEHPIDEELIDAQEDVVEEQPKKQPLRLFPIGKKKD